MSTIINPEHPSASGRLLDTAEVAELLHVTPRQVARLRQSGKLKCVRITGAAVRHTREQVEALLQTMRWCADARVQAP